MSTSSLIGAVQPDKSVRYIYCHSDGYLEYNGTVLRDHYSDPAKIGALLDLGDISILRQEIGEKHNFEWRMQPPFATFRGIDWDAVNADPRSKWTRAYGRDRDEKGTEAKTAPTRAEYARRVQVTCFWYLWNGKQWLYRTSDKPRFRPLPKRLDSNF